MASISILEARQRANLLLRVRDELDEADKLPKHSRRQRRQEVLDRARREYGPTWDEDGAVDALDAADEWHEPNAAESNAIKQLAACAVQGIKGAA